MTKPKAKADFPAVLMRAARRGLQIVPLDEDLWATVTGSNARVVLDTSQRVIWVHPNATVACLEEAVRAADPNSYPPYLVIPDQMVHVGTLGQIERGRPAVRVESTDLSDALRALTETA